MSKGESHSIMKHIAISILENIKQENACDVINMNYLYIISIYLMLVPI